MEKEKCKKCGSENTVMVEYDMIHPEHYDGISEIACQSCGARFGRWSGRELVGEDFEKRGGRKIA